MYPNKIVRFWSKALLHINLILSSQITTARNCGRGKAKPAPLSSPPTAGRIRESQQRKAEATIEALHQNRGNEELIPRTQTIEMERTSQTTTTMTQQNLRRKALSSSSTYFKAPRKILSIPTRMVDNERIMMSRHLPSALELITESQSTTMLLIFQIR